jgi:hypothetical protein
MAVEGAQKQEQIATFRVSPRLQNEGKGAVEVLMHSYANDSIRRRASPRSAMSLNIPPFQPQEAAPSTPRPSPLRRSLTTK